MPLINVGFLSKIKKINPFKQWKEKCLQVNTRYKSKTGIVVRSVRSWEPEITKLYASPFSWRYKSVSILTHGVPQSVMSWDNRELTFSILNENCLTFRYIGDRDQYGRNKRTNAILSTEQAIEARRKLVIDIKQRNGDIPANTGFLYADVATQINESIVDLRTGINCIDAIAFKITLNEAKNIFELEQYLSKHCLEITGDFTLCNQIDFVLRLMDAYSAKILIDQLRSDSIPILTLDPTQEGFSVLSTAENSLYDIKILAEKIMRHPEFYKVYSNPADHYSRTAHAFVRVFNSYEKILAGEIPAKIKLYKKINQTFSFFKNERLTIKPNQNWTDNKNPNFGQPAIK